MIEKKQAYHKSRSVINRMLDLVGLDWSLYGHRPRIIYSGVVSLSGTSYERGVAHGRLFRPIIPDLVQRNLNDPLQKVSEESLRTHRDELMRSYSSRSPQLIEEIQGIAAGAGLPFSKVFDYDLQAILLLDLFPRAAESCTSFRLRDPNGEIIHAGSLDSGLPDGSYLVKKVSPKSGQSYAGGMVVGTTWTTFGMNAAGLTVGGGSVNSKRESQEIRLDGLDVSSVTSLILESASCVEEAKDLLDSFPTLLPLNSGSNLIISDTVGGAMKVEIHDGHCNFVLPKKDILFCTNHYTDEMHEWNRHDTDYVGQLHSASVARYRTLEEYFKDQSKHTFQGVKKILRWHKQPGAICRHRGRDGELGQTTISYIMMPSRKWMHYWIGNACQGRPRKVEL